MKLKALTLQIFSIAFLAVCLIKRVSSSDKSTNNSGHIKLVDHEKETDNSGKSQDQVSLDTIVSALKKLPDGELERLGLDITAEFIAGTPSGDSLREVWKRRQAELKEAMSSIVKPAEVMADLSTRMRDSTDTIEIVSALLELETFLVDVDNARDYHTIGGWSTLVGLLLPSQPAAVRSTAAWAVGTAIKNSYDYQLWTLEKVTDLVSGETTTCIELLLAMLSTTDDTDDSDDGTVPELLKKTLYALSAAMRGNVDVQGQVVAIVSRDDPSSLMRDLMDIAVPETAPTDLMRKVWSLVADMLEERRYIRIDMVAEHALESVMDEEELQAFLQISLIGDLIVAQTERLLQRSVEVLESYFLKEEAATVKATISSVLVAVNEILSQSPESISGTVQSRLTAFLPSVQNLFAEDGNGSEFVVDDDDEPIINERSVHDSIRLAQQITNNLSQRQNGQQPDL